jgi:ubiquinone/menaquinone biosynthesis C-methylase UbiE
VRRVAGSVAYRSVVGSDQSLRRYGQVFDGVAEAYDDVRPSYPAELVTAAMERGGLVPGSPALEIGCGTGKLTELLADRGLVVDAVDPGPKMVEIARRRVDESAQIRFHIGKFEEVSLPLESFDAVFAASAFHWVDPDVGWQKVAAHLRPQGLLALLTHIGVSFYHELELDQEFRSLLEEYAPEAASALPPVRDLETILAGVDARAGNVSEVWDWLQSGGRHSLARDEAATLFEDVQLAKVVSTVEQTADEALAHFRTTSLYFQIEPSRRAAFEDDDRRIVERHGGTLKYSLAAVLVTAKRVAAR